MHPLRPLLLHLLHRYLSHNLLTANMCSPASVLAVPASILLILAPYCKWPRHRSVPCMLQGLWAQVAAVLQAAFDKKMPPHGKDLNGVFSQQQCFEVLLVSEHILLLLCAMSHALQSSFKGGQLNLKCVQSHTTRTGCANPGWTATRPSVSVQECCSDPQRAVLCRAMQPARDVPVEQHLLLRQCSQHLQAKGHHQRLRDRNRKRHKQVSPVSLEFSGSERVPKSTS